MLRKIVAIAMTVVLIACLTACDRGRKKPEEKESLKPHGFSVYVTRTNYGEEVYTRRLCEKYDDLVSEVTHTKYDVFSESGDTTDITKWYYDDTGTYLLKKVVWSYAWNVLTTSTEYDHSGRKIRYSVIQDHEFYEDVHYAFPQLPEEYYNELQDALPEMYSILEFFSGLLTDGEKELTTEYAYQGDSDKLASIKTMTGNGDVIARIEWDGDVIINARIEGTNKRYEETYFPKDHRSEWKIFDEDLLLGRDGEPVVHYGGEKEYDDSGRLVCGTEYVYDENGKRDLRYENVTTYDAEGSIATLRVYDIDWIDGTAWCSENVIRYDHEGRKVKRELFEKYEDGTRSLQSAETLTYHKNGEIATEVCETRDSKAGKMTPYEYREYDENGENLVYRRYSNGKIDFDREQEYLDVPGIAGKVMHTLRISYYEGEFYYSSDEYSVGVKVGAVDDYWIEYRDCVKMGQEGPEEYYSAAFDSVGNLVRVDHNFGGGWEEYEYDSQGRLVRSTNNNDETVDETVYEYWDEETGRPTE